MDGMTKVYYPYFYSLLMQLGEKEIKHFAK